MLSNFAHRPFSQVENETFHALRIQFVYKAVVETTDFKLRAIFLLFRLHVLLYLA